MAIELEPAVLASCSYATPADMVKRFGLTEMLCASDKSKCGSEEELSEGTESYNRLICALNDANALLNQKLCCCFDAKQICTWVKEGKKFPLLTFWQATIARYYLHDVISYSGKTETEQYRRFKQLLSDIEKFCDPGCCTVIVDETGECCLEKLCKVGFAVAKREKSCIPDVYCVPKSCCNSCGCQISSCACLSISCSSKGCEGTPINSYIGGRKNK